MRRRRRAQTRAQAASLSDLAAFTDGRLAAHARHLESGRTLALDGGRRCKLASVVKVPLAVHVLEQVADGRLGLDDRIEVEGRHMCEGSGVIATWLRAPGLSLSVDNLLRLALRLSDNTATDVLFEVAGGPEAVQTSLNRLGHDAVRVDRTIAGVVDAVTGPEATTFYDDDRDTASPEAVVDLLADLWAERLLSPNLTAHLLEILGACKTGRRRFRAHMPTGSVVAQKTGTFVPKHADALVADAGVLRLPGDAGHVAVAAFLTGATAPTAEQEDVVAHVARVAYEAFQHDTPLAPPR
ncbi:MAG: serine hydrolase [Bacteroidota bacterium]